ncbi:MAG: hypothetical protein ACE5KF_05050 [Kiloniellaceae bacterium]
MDLFLGGFAETLPAAAHAVVDACCRARNDLTKSKTLIQSLTSYPWIAEVAS